ncbi:MAG: hypothetical protein KAQ66_06095 [Rhodospirillaceae bacterium]|nr:hypothetical protein [Rhodospirillaceae bacterium]
MLKNITLNTVMAAALVATLSVSITAPASAVTTNSLSEWSGFGKETKTPMVAYDKSINWAKLYS